MKINININISEEQYNVLYNYIYKEVTFDTLQNMFDILSIITFQDTNNKQQLNNIKKFLYDIYKRKI